MNPPIGAPGRAEASKITRRTRCYQHGMKNVFPRHLSDRALVAEVMRLARTDRDTMVQLVTHLAELDRRKLFRPAGYSSLFMYCYKVLQLSEEEAYNRMVAARTVRRFPEILDFLADGSLNLTALRLIGKRLTPENHQELIQGARRKSKREVLELVARLFPQPDVPATVRTLPSRAPGVPPLAPPASAAPPPEGRPSILADAAEMTSSPAGPAPTTSTTVAAPIFAAPPSRPAIAPLAPERYQITFTASSDTREKLEFARDLLRHALPDGDIPAIMDRALTVLIDDLVRKKFALTDKPRPGQGPAKDSSYIPAEVKRTVYVRDRGRCTFVGRSGVRCNERAFVEFEHIIPRARGGKATVENTCLLCASHNAYTAELHFGPRNPEGVVREASPAYDSRIVNNTRSGTGVVNKHCTDQLSALWRERGREEGSRDGSINETSEAETSPDGPRIGSHRVPGKQRTRYVLRLPHVKGAALHRRTLQGVRRSVAHLRNAHIPSSVGPRERVRSPGGQEPRTVWPAVRPAACTDGTTPRRPAPRGSDRTSS